MEHTIFSAMPHILSSKISPYLFGVSATIAGVFINKIISGGDSIYDFQTHLDQQLYINEMKELYLRRDQFGEVLLVAFVIIVLNFIFSIFLAIKIRGVNMKLHKTKDNFELKLKNSESVIESILKDFESIDLQQITVFKSDAERQRTAFADLIHNKSLELETKLAEAKNTCSRAKKCVHEDLSKIEKLVGNIQGMKEEVRKTNESLEVTRSNTKLLEIDVKHFTEDINKKIDESITSLSSKISEIGKKIEGDSVDIFKCNSLLLNAELLLEASILKFEALEAIETTDSNQNPSFTRITKCIEKAKEFHDFMNQSSITGEDTPGPTNAALYQILQAIDALKKKVSAEELSILKNTDAIKDLHMKVNYKLIELKSESDDWIKSWISVIYGLFSSSFLQLESQLFGIDFMEYNVSNNEKLDDPESLKLFEQIKTQCKKTCIRTIKEVNLLTFEYYLIQKSQYSNSPSLTNMCYLKIDQELEELFHQLELSINTSDLCDLKKTIIKSIVLKLKHGLASDLKSDTNKFNLLVRQNLDDFHIIHETMKSINSSEFSKDSINDGDSVIELSDYSNSLISLHNDESFSESDSSMLETSISETKLKPLKLADSSATKRKNLSL